MISVTVLERGLARRVLIQDDRLDAFREEVQAHGGQILTVEVQGRRRGGRTRTPAASAWVPWFSALARTLKGRVPLDRALDLLADASPSPEGVKSLENAVTSGQRFSDAVATCLQGIPSLVPALLRAGESAGDLARGVSLAHQSMSAQLAFQRELKSKLAYPLVVVSSSALALLVLMVKVFPAMSGMWLNLGKPLPPRLEAIRLLGWLAILALVGIAIGMAWLMSGSEQAQRLPGFRALGRHKARSEAWSALAMALGGGVPLLEALDMLGTRWGAAAMKQAVQQGARPEEALSGWVDDAPGQRAVLIASLRVGDLAAGAQGVAEGYQELLEQDLRNLQRWLEPVILVLLGSILMALAWGLFSVMGEMEKGLVS